VKRQARKVVLLSVIWAAVLTAAAMALAALVA
jgi:hypothetical protein